MPYSSGTFSRIYNWVNEQLSSPIEISKLDAQEEDFATALNNCILRDGTGLPTAAMDWNGQNLTNVAAFTATGIVTGGRFVPTSSSVPTNGMYLSAANTLAFSSNTTLRWSVNSTGTHTLAAPSSGTTLVVPGLTGTAAAYIGVLGATNNPRVEITGTEASAIAQIDFTGSTGSAAGRISRAGTAVIDISSGRAVSVAAPSSGVALTVNALSGQNGLVVNGSGASINATINGGSGSPCYLALVDGQTGTRPYRLGVGGSAVGAFDIYDGTAAAFRLSIGSAGNVTINAPSSGNTLTASGLSGSAVTVNSSAGAAGTLYSGFNVGLATNFWNIVSSATDPLAIGTIGAAATRLYTNSSSRLEITSAGNFTINAPSSGAALSITSVAGGVPIQWNDGTLTGGISLSSSQVEFGATSNHAASFYTNNLTRVSIAAGGAVTINAPSSGTALTVSGTVAATAVTGDGSGLTSLAAANLTGTVNTARISGSYTGITAIGNATVNDSAGTAYSIGYRGMPQSTNTSIVAADAGKHIFLSGTTNTVTIPANASVAFELGTTIVLVNDGSGNTTLNITTDTLEWLQGGSSSTGSRTIATKSVVTLVKVATTRWIITGAGIS